MLALAVAAMVRGANSGLTDYHDIVSGFRNRRHRINISMDDLPRPPAPQCDSPPTRHAEEFVHDVAAETSLPYLTDGAHRHPRAAVSPSRLIKYQLRSATPHPSPTLWGMLGAGEKFGSWGTSYNPTGNMEDPGEAPMHVAVLHNVWLDKYAWMQTCDSVFVPGACAETTSSPLPLGSTLWHADQPLIEIDVAVTLGDKYSAGFFHWSMCLALWSANLPSHACSSRWLCSHGPSRRVARERWASLYKNFFVKTLLVVKPSYPCYTPSYFYVHAGIARPLCWWLALMPACTKASTPTLAVPATVSTQCRYKDSRVLTNGKELEQALKETFPDIAITTFIARGKPMKTQIRLFARTDLVLGMHGANIAHLPYVRPGTPLIELMPQKTGNMCYYHIAYKLGSRYRMVLLPNRTNEQKFMPAPIDEILHHVSEEYFSWKQDRKRLSQEE
eukprot:gene11111-2016_t